MTTDNLTDYLLGLETRYWTAIRDRDAAAATALSTDPCLVVGAQGTAELSREALGGMLQGATWELSAFELSDPRVHRIADDVAAIAYQVHEQVVVDGEPLEMKANDSSVWVRREGTWLCALHTETIAGDPFGRS